MIRKICQFHFWITVGGAIPCVLTGCDQSYSSSARERSSVALPSAAKQVKTHKVSTSGLERVVEVDGTLAAYEAATLSTKVPGRILSFPVDLGSVVTKGALIAQIDPRDYQLKLQKAEAMLSQARVVLGLPLEGTDDRVDIEKTGTVRQTHAVLEEAQANRDRIKKLSSQGILSQSELDTAEAAYQVAQSRYEEALEEVRSRQASLAQRRAELEIARQELSDTSFYAPFDGTIQERLANVGEYLAESIQVAKIVRTNPLRLRLEVPEREASLICAGQNVRLKTEGSTNWHSGQITRLSPALDDQARVLRVEADIPNPGTLRPGSFVKAEIVVDANVPSILVPPNSIITFAGMEKAFVLEDNKAVEKPVVTGRRKNGSVEVISGLRPGDRLVLDPGNLHAGQPVTAID